MISMRLSFALLFLLSLTAVGCGDDSSAPPADGGLDGSAGCCDDGDPCTDDVATGPGACDCTHSPVCSGVCLCQNAAACADADICAWGLCDAGPPDAGISDAGPVVDTGVPLDSGAIIDAGPPSCGSYGAVCASDASCDSGLVCMEGYCMPNVDICGGIARPMCPTGLQQCFQIVGTDFGGCVTPAEVACVCSSSAASRFVCGSGA